jgi:DNA-binding transcriptional MocR family regulator
MPLYNQIRKQIEEQIISGVLPLGLILPSERGLAAQLDVNRNTVIKAYEQLKDDGLVDSVIGKGTHVIYQKELSEELEHHDELYWQDMVSRYSYHNSASIMSKIMSDVSSTDVVTLSGGFPSREEYPQAIFAKIAEEVVAGNLESLFQSPVKGDRQFLETLKRYLYADKSIMAHSGEMMITSGSQQGLNLIIDTYIRPGDRIIIEAPSFFGAVQLFKKSGAQLISSDVRNGQIDLNHLEYNLRRTPVKFIYLVPNYQNPTGYSMDLKTRHELLFLAKKYRVPIIEEDPYGELYFEQYVPTLKSLDRDNHVIHVGTFSKTISPGFRIGYVIADEVVIKKLVLSKQFADIHANTLSQKLIGRFISEGHYDQHLVKMRKLYETKRDLMARELAQVEDLITFDLPKGGYYIWCKLDERLSVNRLMEHALSEGVDFIPGEFFYSDSMDGKNYFRLNYTYSAKEQLQEGMERLIRAIKKTKGGPYERLFN